MAKKKGGELHMKTSRNWNCIVACLVCLSFFLSSISIGNTYGENMHKEKILVMSGEMLRVGATALVEFDEHLKQYADNLNPINSYLSKIENYDIQIEQNINFWTVEFKLKPLKGRYLKGGGGRITINRTDYKIREKNYFK